MQFIQGQKVKLTDLLSPQETFSLDIEIASSMVTDMALFGLNSAYRLSDESYMIFYNQPSSPCQALRFNSNNHVTQFSVNLSQLNPKIEHLVVTLAIDSQNTLDVMSQLNHSHINIVNANRLTVAGFAFDGKMFAQERAIMLFELYKKDGIWRATAVAQGFNGGLDKLIEHFGGEVANDTPVVPTTTATSLPLANPNIIASPKVSLSKISLDKPESSHRLNLNKTQKSFIVEVIWLDNGDKNSNNDDLDLRVGMLLQGAEEMHYIHAPDAAGSLTSFPYIKHLGDVKQASKNQPGIEKVEINTEIASLLGKKVALVFSVYSAISNGMVSIASLQPKMRMEYENQLIECVFNPSVSPKAKSNLVYTYVIGTAIIDENSITLQHSGQTSKRMSEATPKITWKNENILISIDGKPIFKK